MKKFFALVLAVAMVLSMSTAFASIGWAQGSTAAAATGKVSISVKALEYSGTKQDYEIYGHTNAVVWKEITGRVVKDTLVKFPIVVEVPKMGSDMVAQDYVNAAITVSLTNATAWKVVDVEGTDVAYFNVGNGKSTLVSATLPVSTASKSTFKFTVLAIVDSTANVDCKVSFSMGQKVYDDGTDMFFGNYVMEWFDGRLFSIDNLKTGASINFHLDATNKFTSRIEFKDATNLKTADYVEVDYCLNGELKFNGKCACTDPINAAYYAEAAKNFSDIMSALGFNFSYGNFTTAYCTKAGLGSLLKNVTATATKSIGACTELGVTATTPTVSIPQTGAVSVIGYALVALAGAALAISKKN